jgi:O-acetyl-ADP-ribose deacetylase (regulator of RNase III)
MDKNKIEIIFGDITKMSFDVVVNSANKSLLAGGGVDGAIHKAAGPQLEEECKEIGGCPIGEARITKSYGLGRNNVSWIIHAVGPRWFDGTQNEDKLLESAYMNSLKLALNYKEVYTEQCVSILMKYIEHKEKAVKDKLIKEVREEAERYAEEHPIRTIAFPSISTGIYHFPIERAIEIANRTIKNGLKISKELERVAVVCFDERTYRYYNNKV